jgi:hypothetical protein
MRLQKETAPVPRAGYVLRRMRSHSGTWVWADSPVLTATILWMNDCPDWPTHSSRIGHMAMPGYEVGAEWDLEW